MVQNINYNQINLAIAFDRNYLTPFYVLIESIFQNNKYEKIVFHCIINDDVSKKDINKIESCINQHGGVLKQYKVDEALLSKFVITKNWTSAVYYKMFFPLLVHQDLKRLIYLDTDMVVIGKLSSIFDIDLENYPLGAVYDNYVKVQPDIGITEEGKYFNSGMLYYNLPLWRELNISEKAVKYLSAYPERIKFVDQCALNAVINGNWKTLSEKFNLLFSYVPKEISKKELLVFVSNKVVIHYTLQRPWNLFCQNRLRIFYFKYYKSSKNLNGNPITDFSILNLKKWIKMRLIELYFDFGIFNVAWRGMKKAVKFIK